MAAVEDDEEGGGGVEAGDDVSVQGIAVKLAVLFKVHGNDSVVEAGGAVAVGVFDLSTMAGVV